MAGFGEVGRSGQLAWFSYDDLVADLPLALEIFEAKWGRKAMVLSTKDGQAAPERFGLVGKTEMYLE